MPGASLPIHFEKGKASFKLADNEVAVFEGLPVGANYTVTETLEDEFTTTLNGQTYSSDADAFTGLLREGTSARAAFVNTRKTTELTIEEEVDSKIDSDKNEFFHFTMKHLIRLLKAPTPVSISRRMEPLICM